MCSEFPEFTIQLNQSHSMTLLTLALFVMCYLGWGRESLFSLQSITRVFAVSVRRSSSPSG